MILIEFSLSLKYLLEERFLSKFKGLNYLDYLIKTSFKMNILNIVNTRYKTR